MKINIVTIKQVERIISKERRALSSRINVLSERLYALEEVIREHVIISKNGAYKRKT